MRVDRIFKERPSTSAAGLVAALVLFMVFLAGCASIDTPVAKENPENPTLETVELKPLDALALEEQWGLRLLQARLTAQGGMIDVRFMVIEPAKAKGLEESLEKAIIVDENSGRYTWGAHSSKVGSLRDVNLDEANRVCYILFVNPGRMIHTGSSVVLVSEEVQLGRLIVE